MNASTRSLTIGDGFRFGIGLALASIAVGLIGLLTLFASGYGDVLGEWRRPAPTTASAEHRALEQELQHERERLAQANAEGRSAHDTRWIRSRIEALRHRLEAAAK